MIPLQNTSLSWLMVNGSKMRLNVFGRMIVLCVKLRVKRRELRRTVSETLKQKMVGDQI